jgi:hypothetical protein
MHRHPPPLPLCPHGELRGKNNQNQGKNDKKMLFNSHIEQ